MCAWHVSALVGNLVEEDLRFQGGKLPCHSDPLHPSGDEVFQVRVGISHHYDDAFYLQLEIWVVVLNKGLVRIESLRVQTEVEGLQDQV